jgi:hypothetical protein
MLGDVLHVGIASLLLFIHPCGPLLAPKSPRVRMLQRAKAGQRILRRNASCELAFGPVSIRYSIDSKGEATAMAGLICKTIILWIGLRIRSTSIRLPRPDHNRGGACATRSPTHTGRVLGSPRRPTYSITGVLFGVRPWAIRMLAGS